MQELSNRREELIKEAEQWLKDNGPSGIAGPFPNRSCWNCNSSHEHLREADYPIDCFECGHIYFHGERLTTTEDEEVALSHNKDCAVTQSKIASPKSADADFSQS